MVEIPVAEQQAASLMGSRRFSILVVEDEESQALVLSRRLENLGYNILVARDGEEALALIHRRHPDLVITDYILPDIDGLQLAERLTESSELCAIPVIMLSGVDQPEILRKSRAAGCRYFVRKPYDPNALLLLIENSLPFA